MPGTKLTIDTEALDPELAVKLFRMENGQPVQITISEIQDRMPMEDEEPKPPEGEQEPEPIPAVFQEAIPAEDFDPTAPV